MDIVCTRDHPVVPDDKSYPHAIHEVWREKRSSVASEVNSDPACADFHLYFTMAGSSSDLPFLHCHIFALQKQDRMNFSVQVRVMPLKELLDPQGKAVMGGLQNLGINTVQDVRIGKMIQLQVDAASSDEAKKIAEEASKKLLANPVMEYYEITVA
jgi:phosphoribosylformylglycinamidine synthase PurS subunit